MKKAIFYDHVSSAAQKDGIEIEEMMKRVRALGFEGLEINYSYFNKDLPQKITDAGLETSSVYIFCEHKSIDSKSEKERFLNDSAALGSSKVMIEDFDLDISPCCGVERLRTILDEEPELGWTFDTGNFIYCGQDALEAFEILKYRLSHFHAKDRRLEPLYESDRGKPTLDGTMLYPSPSGDGILKIKECIAAVKRQGYDDYMVMEHFGTDENWAYMNVEIKNFDF